MKGLMGLPTMGLLRLTNQLGTKGVRRRKKLKSSQLSWRGSVEVAVAVAMAVAVAGLVVLVALVVWAVLLLLVVVAAFP